MYIKLKITIIVTISLLLGSISVLHAQNSVLSPTFPTIIPQTPEVTKLMGMINYPVSYNTGTVKTEIPIYEIKLPGGYTLPIKLVYQSSGFKPRERSNVGVGWTLIAEPQIAHAVNGLPDEDRNGLYVNKGLNVNWASAEYPFERYVYIDMAYGRYDIEPDQYFYQLPNKGGSFFLSRNPTYNDQKEFVTVPYDPIRVEGIDNLKKFRLTDIDGVEYSFIPIEKTHTVSPEASTYTDAITVYKADHIVTSNNETINFYYEDEPHISRISNYEQSTTLDIKSMTDPATFFDIPYCGESENVFTDEAISYMGYKYNHQVKLIQRDVYGEDAKVTTSHVFESDGVKNNDTFEMCNYRNSNLWQQSISTQKLSRIYFGSGSVEFIYSKAEGNYTLEKFLSGIIVKDGNGNIIKEYHLVTELAETERPYLKEVRILSNDGFSHRKYSFQYYARVGVAYDNPEINVWGYSQYQKNKNQTYIPKLRTRFGLPSLYDGLVRDSINFCYGENDYYKDADTDMVNTTFMLKSITYPTGGKTDFIYEYGKFFESLRQKEVTTGCLRVKEIKNYQSDGMLSSKRLFKYGKGESGLGLPVRLLKDSDFMTSYWQDNYCIAGGWAIYWTFTHKMYKVDIHAHPVVNDFLDASASIVYDQVTEYADEQGKRGKTVYEYDYSNLQDIQSERIIEPYPLQPIMHKEALKKYREWSTGQLINKSVYDVKGTLLQREENTYIEKPGEQVYRMIIYPHQALNFSNPLVRSWETIRILKAGDIPNPVDDGAIPRGKPEAYQFDGRLSFWSGCKLLHSKIVSTYKNGKAISDTMQYSYNDQLLPTDVKQTINNGKTKSETFSYPTDFEDKVSTVMVGKNILSPVIRHTTTIGDAFYDVYTPYRLEADIPVIDRIETGKGKSERETRVRFTKYGRYGTLLEAEKDNDQLVAYLYGYGFHYPVAKIEGAGYDYISEEQGHLENYSDSTTLANKCAALREGLKGTGLVTSYTYRPLIGITSITQPNGDRTSYEYNNFGELVSEANIGGEKEKQYSYYYKYNGNQSPLKVSLSAQNMYYLGKHDFSATASGGMGEGYYKYQWFLSDGKDINYQSNTSISGTFSYKFTQTGNYKLTCRVEDTWGHSSSTTVEFEVKIDLSIRFENMNSFIDGDNKFMEAYIKCPVEMNITFRLVYNADTMKGVTYWINDNEFHGKGNGMDVVTVKFPKGSSHIYIMFPKNTPYYNIEIIGTDVGASIEYPFIMMNQ